MLKRLLFIIAVLVNIGALAQTYSPTNTGNTTISKPMGANGFPVDARTYFYDAVNFKFRPYVSVAEVKSYLATSANRTGISVVVNTGGTLLNGVITGGTNAEWWFKDGTADNNLVLKIPPAIDTASLSNRINAKYGAQDTVSIIATKYYVDKSGTISSSPSNGDTYSSLNGFVALFSKTNNPTGSLSGGQNLQRSASNYIHYLTYSYGRGNLNTNPIASATINPGSFNVFSGSPSQGTSAGGTQSVTTTANTNTTYTIHIVTNDGKYADFSTADNWYGNAYYGRAAGTSATSGEVLAAVGGGSPLVNSTAQGGISTVYARANPWTVTASGSNHPFIAIPATLGHITVFTLTNGTDISTLFHEATVSITNASSYPENYYVYTMSTAQTADLTFVTN